MPRLNDIVQPHALTVAYLGIDPGASGGAAVLDGTGKVIDVVGWSGKTVKDIWEWISQWQPGTWYQLVHCVIEKVWGHIGGPGQPGSAMFKFGQGFGQLLMGLTAAGISYEEVTPQKWQKGIGTGARKKEESKTQWKGRLKSKAQSLFPSTGVTLATADSLLIAEYCRRVQLGIMA